MSEFYDLTKAPKEIIVDLFNRSNETNNPHFKPITAEQLTLGLPQPSEGKRNTRLAISIEREDGGVENRTIYYDRIALHEILPEGVAMANATGATTKAQILSAAANAASVDAVFVDADFAAVSVKVPGSVQLRALPNNLIYTGQVAVALGTQPAAPPAPQPSFTHTLLGGTDAAPRAGEEFDVVYKLTRRHAPLPVGVIIEFSGGRMTTPSPVYDGTGVKVIADNYNGELHLNFEERYNNVTELTFQFEAEEGAEEMLFSAGFVTEGITTAAADLTVAVEAPVVPVEPEPGDDEPGDDGVQAMGVMSVMSDVSDDDAVDEIQQDHAEEQIVDTTTETDETESESEDE